MAPTKTCLQFAKGYFELGKINEAAEEIDCIMGADRMRVLVGSILLLSCACLNIIGDTLGPSGETGLPAAGFYEPIPGIVTIEWEGGVDVGVERRLSGDSEWVVLGSLGSSEKSFNDPTIGRGKTYEYRFVEIGGEVKATFHVETLRSRLANISTRGVLGTGINSLILGFSIAGEGDIKLLTRTQGLGLGGGQLAAPTAIDPYTRLYETVFLPAFDNVFVRENDDWGDTQLNEINALMPCVFAVIPFDDNSLDSAMALTLDGTRLFTMVATDLMEANAIGLVEVFDATKVPPNDALNQIVNLATRGFVGTEDNILIGGFIVDGLVDCQLLLRGIGPSLATPDFGNLPQQDVLSDSKITLFRTDFSTNGFPNVEIGKNDNWEDAANWEEMIAVSSRVGATNFESDTNDAALLLSVEPGLYTFLMEGVDGGTGIGLIELFLAD